MPTVEVNQNTPFTLTAQFIKGAQLDKVYFFAQVPLYFDCRTKKTE